jgi:preprotein translocase subunit SecD
VAAPVGTLRVRNYFIALLAILIGLYALLVFGGSRHTPKLGLDLQGGTTLTLSARNQNGKAPTKDQLSKARDIIDQRVNAYGVSEAEVVTEGNRNIVVSVPGKENDSIKNLGRTAQLRFREVLQSDTSHAIQPKAKKSSKKKAKASPSPSVSKSGSATPSASTSPSPSTSATAQHRALSGALADPTASPSTNATPSTAPSGTPSAAPSSVPPDPKKLKGTATGEAIGAQLAAMPASQIFQDTSITCPFLALRPPGSTDDPKKQQVVCDDQDIKYLTDVAKVIGTDVKTASWGTGQNGVGWQVNLSFTNKGQDKWTKLTQATVNKQVAIILDDQVVSAPTIESVISGDAQISGGNIDRTEAKSLAADLKFGALPLSFDTPTAEVVSPTLGSSQLRGGLIAGGIGLLLVVLYSMVYYRGLGLVTIASLALSASILYSMVVLLGRLMGFTLSLAGIAGFIVAVGITADSFVVFFERIKDEIHEGRTPRSAVPRAWVRARRTIISADTVSLLAAGLLYYFAIGAVQGFAFTLGLSTIIDLVVVFLFTHPLVSLISRTKAFASPRVSGLGRVHRAPLTRSPAPQARQTPTTAKEL